MQACTACEYRGVFTNGLCPECGKRGRGRPRPETLKTPEVIPSVRMGSTQAEMLGKLEEWSGLDNSKVIRVAVAALYDRAQFDGVTPEQFEAMAIEVLGSEEAYRDLMGAN